MLGFEILGSDAKGAVVPKTDWPIRRSFPVFVMNAIRYLGGAAGTTATPTVKPGAADGAADRDAGAPPAGPHAGRPRGRVQRDAQNAFVFSDTELLGVYDVLEGKAKTPAQRFAVNLFDSRESDLRPRAKIELGHETVTGQGGLEPARKETWKWIVLASLRAAGRRVVHLQPPRVLERGPTASRQCYRLFLSKELEAAQDRRLGRERLELDGQFVGNGDSRETLHDRSQGAAGLGDGVQSLQHRPALQQDAKDPLARSHRGTRLDEMQADRVACWSVTATRRTVGFRRLGSLLRFDNPPRAPFVWFSTAWLPASPCR